MCAVDGRMIQLLIRMAAPFGHAVELVDALWTVTRPAQQARGCRFVQVYRWTNDDLRIDYVEEWDDAEALSAHFGSERFTRLLELLESAAEPPLVEFRVVSETHGLEYIAQHSKAARAAGSQSAAGAFRHWLRESRTPHEDWRPA